MPFDTSLAIRRFLLERDAGNMLLYGGGTPLADVGRPDIMIARLAALALVASLGVANVVAMLATQSANSFVSEVLVRPARKA